MPGKSQTEQNTNGVLKHLKNYMDLRFAHARRLNPKFRQIEADIKWHELECVRQVIARPKPLGEVRVAPVDIMSSFDFDRKRGVFATKGQLSILNEIVTKEDIDLVKHGGGGGGSGNIRDLCSFYQAIDPFMKAVVELMQHWVWWDLPDASDMHILDTQFDRLRVLPKAQLNEGLANYYRNEMKLGQGGEPTIQSIIDFEFVRTEETVVHLTRRREAEENYQGIIARETSSDQSRDALIIQLAQHVRAAEAMASSHQIDPNLKDYYAKTLSVAPEDLTWEKAHAHEQKFIDQSKEGLFEVLCGGTDTGAHYNYKQRQAAEMRKKLETVRAELRPQASAQPVEPAAV